MSLVGSFRGFGTEFWVFGWSSWFESAAFPFPIRRFLPSLPVALPISRLPINPVVAAPPLETLASMDCQQPKRPASVLAE